MTWESFCQWWINLFNAIGTWFIAPDTAGLNYLTRIILAIVFIVVGHYLIKLLIKVIRKALKLNTKLEVDVSAKSFAVDFINIVLQVILVILVLTTLKFNLTSLAAIFSAATVAIGLSLQNLISALASGVILLRAHHFKTGDYIAINHAFGNCEGTVKKVSMLSTSLQTVDNQTIIIPNNKLLEGIITNFDNQKSRRAVLKVNVEYNADIEKVKKVILDTIKKDSRILKNPAPSTHVSSLGDYSIQMAIKFHTKINDYWDVYNGFLEQIIIAFKENNIPLATNKIRIVNELEKNQTTN